MVSKEVLHSQLAYTLADSNFPELGRKIPGKVRDSYVIGNERILITSDRLSAFDRVLTTIPFKGQLLNDLAAYWFKQTEDIVENHLHSRPHPNIFVAEQVQIVPVEVVVRGYLAGSAWRDYEAGRDVSGVLLPKGMRKAQKLEHPIITPSTKEESGKHDMPISSEEVVRSGRVERGVWEHICAIALRLFARGTDLAAKHGLILVDTKYEFGLRQVNGQTEVVLADEIHTQDCSRYWELSSYQERFERGDDPEMFDKEFVRRWLLSKGYMGEGSAPEFPDEFRVEVAELYIRAFERLTGQSFQPVPGPVIPAIQAALRTLSQANP